MDISSIALGLTIIFNMVYMLCSLKWDDNDLYNILNDCDDEDDEKVVFEYNVVDDSDVIWFEVL